MRNMKMIEIGKETTISAGNFKNLITLLFGRHGDIEIDGFNEEGKGISKDDMTLYYLKMTESKAKDMFNDADFEIFQDEDGDFHIATWQNGKGWIVDYSIIRRLLIWAAHAYPDPQPCVNCDVYRVIVDTLRKSGITVKDTSLPYISTGRIVGESNRNTNETCEVCIMGDGWKNFTMEIQEEEYI